MEWLELRVKELGKLRESHREAQDGETGCSQMILFQFNFALTEMLRCDWKKERKGSARERELGVLPFHGG